jgi:hypothetical protein
MQTINAYAITTLFLLLAVSLLDCCTISQTMVHTEGQATDVVDETQAASAQVTPTISIPAI